METSVTYTDVIATPPTIPLEKISNSITPTIMKCSMGGFIITIPGKGVAARTSFADAMEFLSQEVHRECYGQGRDIPKIIRDVYQNQPLALQASICAGIVAAGTSVFALIMRVIA